MRRIPAVVADHERIGKAMAELRSIADEFAKARMAVAPMHAAAGWKADPPWFHRFGTA